MAELGAVCRELRISRFGEKGGFWELGYHIHGGHGRGARALRAFEAGKPVDHVDEKVEAYAAACEVSWVSIVDEAHRRLVDGQEIVPLDTEALDASIDSAVPAESEADRQNDREAGEASN